MCTSINFINGDHYFGRNLDLEVEFPVDVVYTPENYEFKFRHIPALKQHHAMIGMSLVQNDYPLYFEAINNKGLGMAGLAFAGMAVYHPVVEGKTNLGSFEFIQYILGTCETVEEARKELENINITNEDFSNDMRHSPLHWQIGDKKEAIVVESTKDGFHVHDNPIGVLTNCPTFDFQMTNLSNYMNITNLRPVERFAPDYPELFNIFSAGMGTCGLPGGVDSVSRFVRCSFAKLNSHNENVEYKNVAQYLHLLGVVQQVAGEDMIEPDVYEITQYSSCGNTTKGLFYWTTYYNPNVYCVDMNKEDASGTDLVIYKVPQEPTFTCLN